MIELRNITYSYPNQASPILENITLTVTSGEFLLVVGPSGAGKSTLLRCFNGLVPHFYGGNIQGQVEVAGRDPIALGPRGMSDLVGFVFQDPEAQFVTEQVEDELAFAMENHNFAQVNMRRRVEEVLDQLSMAHLRERRIDTLSGGERQRVAIGSVLTLQPAILVLDEPTSQLDPQAAEEILTTLQKLNHDLGLTIIVSEHRLERVAQYADRICYMPGNGRPILTGSPRQVLAQVDLAPPLAQLGRKLNWQPLPLTIKEGRPFAVELKSRLRHESPVAQNMLEKIQAKASPVITLENVWYRYNSCAEALKEVNLTIRRGERVVLMGRNGSGKSTLLKSIVGLLHPQQGRVNILGCDTRQTDLLDITRRVGFVPQNPGRLLFHDTVAEELAFTRNAHQLAPIDFAGLLQSLGLVELTQAYPRDLSSGERQRVALAAILAAEPEILLLDEPTRGLDYQNKILLTQILNTLSEHQITIVMATHDVELVAHCADRVIIMGEGQVVVDGPVREVMTESLIFASQINKLLRDNRFLTVEDVMQTLEKRIR
ncbi:MAG: ABC transporter ATP-binding protein [Anaerolineae bacterium]|nr:ABC transporter ATP-binding protein [Anaerolineae bacterium]